MDKPKSPPPSTSQPHATAVDSSPSFFSPQVDKLKAPSPSASESHSTTPTGPMDNFISAVLKCAAAKEPLNPSQEGVIRERINKILPHIARTPDHPPYACMIENAIRELDVCNVDSISNFIINEYKDLPYTHTAILNQNLSMLSETGHLVRDQNGCYSIGKSNCTSMLYPNRTDTKIVGSIPNSSRESLIPVASSSEEHYTKSPIPVFGSSMEQSCSSEESSSTSDDNFRPQQQRKLKKRKKRRNTKHNAGRGCRRGGAWGRGLGRGYGRGLDPANTNPEKMMIQIYNEGVESEAQENILIIEPKTDQPELMGHDNREPHSEIRRGRGRPRKQDVETGDNVRAPETGIKRGRGRPPKREIEAVVQGQIEASEVMPMEENLEGSAEDQMLENVTIIEPETRKREIEAVVQGQIEASEVMHMEENLEGSAEDQMLENVTIFEPETEVGDYSNRFPYNDIRRERGSISRRHREMWQYDGASKLWIGQGGGRPAGKTGLEMEKVEESRGVENFMMERKREMEMGEHVCAPDNGIRRGRGRPRKVDTGIVECVNATEAVIKRGPGRPRKIGCVNSPQPAGIKRGRGRPRKIDIEMAEYGNDVKLGEASEVFSVEKVGNIRIQEDFLNMVLKNGETSEVVAVEEKVGGIRLQEDLHNMVVKNGKEDEVVAVDENRLQEDILNMTNIEEGESELVQEEEIPDWNKD